MPDNPQAWLSPETRQAIAENYTVLDHTALLVSVKHLLWSHADSDRIIAGLKAELELAHTALKRLYPELAKLSAVAQDPLATAGAMRRRSEALAATPPATNELREWVLDRYGHGQLKAEGARVHAATFEDAIEKARKLFTDDPDAIFKLRGVNPTGQGGKVDETQ